MCHRASSNYKLLLNYQLIPSRPAHPRIEDNQRHNPATLALVEYQRLEAVFNCGMSHVVNQLKTLSAGLLLLQHNRLLWLLRHIRLVEVPSLAADSFGLTLEV